MRKQTITRPILPACLLVAGKPCLVVGGGPVAARKVGHLLDAEADVTVVSPTLCDELGSLARNGKIHFIERAFEASDVGGNVLAFAATDQAAVNRRVLEACRRHNVLGSASDENWPDGHFVTPAICRQNGLVVTVSTSGRSCRQAKAIKDRIAALLETIVNETRGAEGA